MLQDADLRLRPLDPRRDVPAACRWYRDPHVLLMSEGPDERPFGRERVERMYAHLSAIGEVYVIEVREDDRWKPIGDATLAPDTLPIVIGDAGYRGRGLGARVLSLLIGRAQNLGWTSLQAKHIYAYNEPSRRLFRRHGFALVAEGVDERGRAWERYRLQI